MTPTRRGFLTGLGATLVAAPAVSAVPIGQVAAESGWPMARITYPDVAYAQVQYSSLLRTILDEVDAPRYRWKREWRRQRLARRGVVEQPPVAQSGFIEGIRFID